MAAKAPGSLQSTGKIDDETKSIDVTLQQLVDQFNTLQGPSKPDLTCTPTQGHISGNELCRLVHSNDRFSLFQKLVDLLRRRDGEVIEVTMLTDVTKFLHARVPNIATSPQLEEDPGMGCVAWCLRLLHVVCAALVTPCLLVCSPALLAGAYMDAHVVCATTLCMAALSKRAKLQTRKKFCKQYVNFNKLTETDLRIGLSTLQVGKVQVPIVGAQFSGRDVLQLAHLCDAADSWAQRHPGPVFFTPESGDDNTVSAVFDGDVSAPAPVPTRSRKERAARRGPTRGSAAHGSATRGSAARSSAARSGPRAARGSPSAARSAHSEDRAARARYNKEHAARGSAARSSVARSSAARGSPSAARGSPSATNLNLEQAICDGTEEVVVVAGPSGCGKTSLMWQTLAKRWGIYLSLYEGDVGSSAYRAAWQVCAPQGQGSRSTLSWYHSQRLMAGILLGHMVVLRWLRALDPELTPAEWLLWQLLDPGEHIQTLVYRFLHPDTQYGLVELEWFIEQVQPKQPLIVVLDEAQVWVEERITVPDALRHRYSNVQTFTVFTAVVRYLREATASRIGAPRSFVYTTIVAGTTLRMKAAISRVAVSRAVPSAKTVFARALTEEQAVAFATWFGVSTQCAKDGFEALKASVGYRARFWALAVAKYISLGKSSWLEAIQHTRRTLLLQSGRYSLVCSLQQRLMAPRASATPEPSVGNVDTAFEVFGAVNVLTRIAAAQYFMTSSGVLTDSNAELVVSAGLGIACARGAICDEPVAAVAVVAVMLETPARAAKLHEAIVAGFQTATMVSESCAGFYLELVLASTLSQIMNEIDGTRRRMLATLCGLRDTFELDSKRGHAGACMRMSLHAYLDASHTLREPTSDCIIPEFSAGPDVVNVMQSVKGDTAVLFWQCKYGVWLSKPAHAVNTVVVGQMGRTKTQEHPPKAQAVDAAAAKFDQRVGFVLAPRKSLNVDWVDAQGMVTMLPDSGAAPPHRVVVLDRRLLLTPELKQLFRFPEWLFMVPGQSNAAPALARRGRGFKRRAEVLPARRPCRCKTKCQRNSCGCRRGNRDCSAACKCGASQCANNAVRDADRRRRNAPRPRVRAVQTPYPSGKTPG